MDAMQRYSLSNVTEVGFEASWADIRDPKEKKRIQNRIAQRSYRQRMKARLEKLQAKVNYHEQMSLENSDKDKPTTQPQPHDQQQQQQHPVNQDQPAPVTLESLTPKSPEQQPIQPQVMQATFYEQSIEKGDKSIYIQPQLIDGAQQVPQSHPILPEHGDQAIKTIEKISPEYIQLPKQQQQMMSRHSTPQLGSLSPQQESARMINNHQLFPSEVNDVMDFSNSFDMWTSEMLAATRRQQQQQRPGLASDLSRVGGGDNDSGVHVMNSSMTDMSSLSPVPSAEQGLDERFEYVLGCTRAAGFESFDALVTAYYNGNFEDSSPLAIEQRLSRNRGLPSVIGDVFRDARGWSIWERRGFDEELLKTTESMLVSEGENNYNSLENVLNLLAASPNNENAIPANNQAIPTIKKAVQNELPNLWALMMALSAEHKDVWQRNRSNTVLAAILLLRYPGRIPNHQLLKLVGGCF